MTSPHAIVDDHSRLAYVELLPDEKAAAQSLPATVAEAQRPAPEEFPA
jgi:hypothetical protein